MNVSRTWINNIAFVRHVHFWRTVRSSQQKLQDWSRASIWASGVSQRRESLATILWDSGRVEEASFMRCYHWGPILCFGRDLSWSGQLHSWVLWAWDLSPNLGRGNKLQSQQAAELFYQLKLHALKTRLFAPTLLTSEKSWSGETWRVNTTCQSRSRKKSQSHIRASSIYI